MSNSDVYAPCPCGSGKKYKFCCLKKEREAGKHTTRTPPESLSSFGRRGPAAKMMEFVQPLIDKSDGSASALERCMQLGMVCWNAALTIDRTGDEDTEVDNIVTAMKPDSDEARNDYTELVKSMLLRHRTMFPEEYELAARNRAAFAAKASE